MYYVSRIAGTAALAALGLLVWFSIVLARADFYFRAATPQSTRRAMEIVPRNTEYLALLALQLDYEGADSTALRERIAALNPYSSAPRIRLGLAAEIAGDSASAERWLLEAASVDHQFEARWTLANFYFRAGNRRDEFWKWMRAALEVSYGDRTPAFELCWRVSGDAEEVLSRAIPDRHEVVASYLVYVLTVQQRTAAVHDVAEKLGRYRDASDLAILLSACDRLLDAGDPGALDVWLMTGQAAPDGIFNGDFATAPLNHGFDWRLVESPGVAHENGSRIALSGRQAESCLLMTQTLNVVAGKRYRLSWEARSPAGIAWRVRHGSEMRLLASQDWAAGEFTIDAKERFPILELVYQRPMGESRAEANVEWRHIRLVEVAP
jgi:hypothetical protein